MNSRRDRLITKVLGPMLIVALFATGLMIGGGTALAAPTCSVPSGTYPTIQSAVDDPTCSTIIVAPGAYVENVTINRTLTLQGGQAGNPVSGRTFGGVGESTVTGTITVKAADVKIDGFSLTYSVPLFSATGIDVKTPGSGTVITNNIIDTVTTADTGGNGTAQGIYLENGPDNVQILGNRINNIKSTRSAKGVLIGDSGSTDPSQNVVIQGNSMTNITSQTRGAYGVSVGTKAPLPDSNLQILNNTIDTLTSGGWVHAIGLEANTPNVVVTGNSISNLIGTGPDKLAVWFENENTSFFTGRVNQNNLDVGPAAFGIAVHPALTGGAVDGTCNWWGASNGPGPVGPGSGSKVSPNVIFSPWLTLPAPGGACNGPEQPISAQGTTFSTSEGASFSGPVATFTDPDTGATASEYSASIDWGDGSPASLGTISGGSGNFTVQGNHVYAEEGTYTVKVTITDVDDASNSATATSTASVADAALMASPACPSSSTQAYSGPTATFTDASSTGTLSDFTATIDWGDSSSSGGTITGGPGTAPYTVSGSHNYTTTGSSFTITTTIKDMGGSTVATSCMHVLIFAFGAGSGKFVIGDVSAKDSPPNHVTLFSEQWQHFNKLSGRYTAKEFDGIAQNGGTTCGVAWTTQVDSRDEESDSGGSDSTRNADAQSRNSRLSASDRNGDKNGDKNGDSDESGEAKPAAVTPGELVGVIVSSTITQSGDTVTGNAVHVVIVKVDATPTPPPGDDRGSSARDGSGDGGDKGDKGDNGNAGDDGPPITGVIVATIC